MARRKKCKLPMPRHLAVVAAYMQTMVGFTHQKGRQTWGRVKLSDLYPVFGKPVQQPDHIIVQTTRHLSARGKWRRRRAGWGDILVD